MLKSRPIRVCRRLRRFLLIERVRATINVTGLMLMEWHGKFLLFIGYISRRTYVPRKRARVERQDCVAWSGERRGGNRNADRKRGGRLGTDDTWLRKFCNMHVATRPMHLEVNVGSADLSYSGCTIWHNDARYRQISRQPPYGNEESAESKVPTDLITKILLVVVPLRSSTPRSILFTALPRGNANREFSPHYSGFISGNHSWEWCDRWEFHEMRERRI